MPAQHLYLIEAVGSGYAKIGCSDKPRGRLSEFATLMPFPLVFRHVLRFPTIKAAFAAERFILASAVRHRGEWVILDDALDALLAKVALVADVVTGEFVAPPKRSRAKEHTVEQQALAERIVRRREGHAARDPRHARVLDRLAEGYGAHDVLVMDGIPEATYWAVVADLEAKGKLAALVRGAA